MKLVKTALVAWLNSRTGKIALPVSAVLLTAVLAFCLVRIFVPSGTAAALADDAASSAAATATVSTTSPDATTTPDATPTPTPTPSPTTSPTPAPPCDFTNADFAGSSAGVLERLLKAWGFNYYAPDGKWGADDTYELTLFQRWAGIAPSGAFDPATRSALQAAWVQYAETLIPRTKLPLEGRYIGINAGHQSRADSRPEALSPEKKSPKKARVSSGTQGIVTRVPEYKVTLQVALKLRDSLEAQGARTLLVRTTNDVRISNVERCNLMNAANVDVYISLHCDGNNNRKTHGLHTLIPADRGYQHGAVLVKSQKLARIMQPELIKATGAMDKGYSVRRDLSSFNWSKMPTCLVEMGFMTYAAEDRLLVSDAYQNKLASGYTAAFIRYFNEVK